MAADGVKVIEVKPHTAPTDPPPPVDIDPQDSYAITTQNGIKQEGGFQGKVVQITNVSPQATLQQMATLFGFLGTVTDIQLYPSSEIQQVAVKLCYIKYENSECCAVAQHLTNTVFIDRALIVVPLEKEEIPEEGECSQLLASINAFAGMASAGFLATPGIGAGNGSFPTPPLITCTTEPTEIEEIRRTIYVNNIEEDISSEQILAFFSGVGEIKYLRFCKEAEEGKYAFLEFSNIESVPAAMQYNGVLFAGKPLKVDYAKSPIVKPESERIAAGRGGIRGAGPARKVREVSPTRDRRRSRSRSVSKASSRRRSRSRDSSRRRSRKSRSRSPSRRRRTKSRSRSPVRSKSSRRRSRTRSRSPRRRRKSRSRSRSRDRRRRRRSRTRSKSRSPKRRSRSRSKGRRRKSRSRSGSRMRKRSRSKTKSRSRSKSVSKSPERKKKSRSRTPPRKKSRSRTPARKSKKSVSKSPDRKRSSKKSVSRSPERKKSSKKSVSRSPERRKSSKKSVSRSPERKRSSKKSVSRSPERKKSSKSSRKDKDRDKDDRKEKSSKEKPKDKEKDRESDEDVSPKKKKSSDK